LTKVYQLLRRPYAKKPFDGEGAYRFGGRWSSPGTRVVYTSEHLSLAMLDYFVHLDPDDPPKDLMLVTAEISDSVSRVTISREQLPKEWRRSPAPSRLAAIGDDFVSSGRSTGLILPSVLAPTESNWLINPAHPGFRQIKVHPAERFIYDTRLFRS
jgi:RES domain-containing protein